MLKKSPLEKLFQSLGDALYDAAMDAAEALKEQATFTPIIPPFPQPATPPRKRPTTRPPSPRTPRPPKTPPSPPKPPETTLYDVLEVSPRASQETITAAFRSLSLKYHPDKNLHGEYTDRFSPKERLTNDQRMRQVTAAYSTLKTTSTRKQYDRSIGLKG